MCHHCVDFPRALQPESEELSDSSLTTTTCVLALPTHDLFSATVTLRDPLDSTNPPTILSCILLEV